MNYNITVPAITEEFENATQVIPVINSIKNKYAGMISNIAAITNLDEAIIYSFIYVESKGNEKAINGKSIGLMQINPDTANLAIVRENLNRGFNEDEINFLRAYLGDRLDGLLKLKYTWKPVIDPVTKEDLVQPEFNLLVGSIYLKQLLYKTKDKSGLRLDKVIWLYNKGEYSKMPSGDVNNLYAQAGDITGKYIRTILGVNGILNQLT